MSLHAEDRDGGVRKAISNMMVRVHAKHAGRGPVKARTYISEDLITCVLEDGLTSVEQTLATDGRTKTVEGVRHALQEAMQKDMVDGIEEISGRKVRAFLSANQVDPDIGVETFLLELRPPRDQEPAAEARRTPRPREDSLRMGRAGASSTRGSPERTVSVRPEPSYRDGL